MKRYKYDKINTDVSQVKQPSFSILDKKCRDLRVFSWVKIGKFGKLTAVKDLTNPHLD